MNEQAYLQWSKHCNNLLSGACLLIVHCLAADKKLAALEFCEQNHIIVVFLVTLHTSFSHWTILFHVTGAPVTEVGSF
jgi:hypothetical protein